MGQQRGVGALFDDPAFFQTASQVCQFRSTHLCGSFSIPSEPFVQLRRLMDFNALLAEKIEALEEKYADHDQQFQLVFEAIKQLIATPTPPTKELGFHTCC